MNSNVELIQGEGEICVIEASLSLSLSTSPLPFIVSSIIWVIWSWGHKFLYNSNPLFRAEASGNYSDCIPDTVPKFLEQIRPSISTALLSIFRCEPGGWTSTALPFVPLCFSRGACREAPCWCWLAAASLHPRPQWLPASLGQCRHSFQARGSCCQAGRHMLPSCFAISRSQGPRPFNFSKPQAFWWRAGFHACALIGVVFVLWMVCEPPAFGFIGTQTKCTYFQFRLWKRAFQCSGSLFHLALFFLDFLLMGGAQFGLVVCVPVFPLLSFFVPTKGWLRGRQHVEGPWDLASGKLVFIAFYQSLLTIVCAPKEQRFCLCCFLLCPSIAPGT